MGTRTDRADIITDHLSSQDWQKRHGGIVFLLLLGLYVLLFLPFWKPVVLGFLFAAASGPLQARIRNALHSRRKPVAFGVFLALLLAMIGFSVILGFRGYYSLTGAFENADSITIWTQKIIIARDHVLTWLQEQDILTSVDINKQIGTMTSASLIYGRDFMIDTARTIVANTPEILLNLFIFLLAFGAFLMMGTSALVSTATILGIQGNHEEQLKRFEKICALALGSVLLNGVVQATLVTIGAAIASVGNLFLIFAMTFIFSMIPFVGGGMLPFILAILAFFLGESSHGVILLITSAVTGLSDNILKAWLFSKASKTNPAISMISLIGGILLMGFAGLFIAPVIEQLVMAEFNRRRQAFYLHKSA